MFNFKSVVDQVASASKTPLVFVEDKNLKGCLADVIDSYADFSKTLYDTNLELAKQVVEIASSVDYTKFFAVK
jgi:hypothetical protein